jgi:hypothetical protein
MNHKHQRKKDYTNKKKVVKRNENKTKPRPGKLGRNMISKQEN